MKRKLLFVSLVATLSTVGFAAPSIDGVVNLKPVVNPSAGNGMVSDSHLKDAIDNINNNFGDISLELVDQIARQEETEALDKEQNDRLDDLNLDMSTVKGTIDNIDITNNKQNEKLDELETNLNNKVDQKEFDEYAGKVEGMNTEIGNINSQLDQKVDKEEFEQKTDSLKQDIDKNKHLSEKRDEQLNEKIDNEIVAREEADKQLNDKIDQNKADQAVTDKKQDAAIEQNRQDIAKGDQINKVQNQQIGALQTENVEQNNRLDKVETENGKQNDRLDKVEDKNTEQDKAIEKEQADRIAADEKLAAQMDKFQGQMNNYGSRIDNLEKRVDNLDNKLNKGLSLMAAMNAVDFQDVAEGEMAIGAGVGHYGNAQSVAIGVAYAPTQNLNVNMKYSVTAGDVDSFAIGAGASYKFRVK